MVKPQLLLYEILPVGKWIGYGRLPFSAIEWSEFDYFELDNHSNASMHQFAVEFIKSAPKGLIAFWFHKDAPRTTAFFNLIELAKGNPAIHVLTNKNHPLFQGLLNISIVEEREKFLEDWRIWLFGNKSK